MFCRQCGAKNEEGAAFCKRCGGPLGSPSQSGSARGTAAAGAGMAGAAAQAAPGNKTHRKVGIAAVAVAAAVIVIVIVLAVSLSGRSYQDTVKKMMEIENPMEVFDLLPGGVTDTVEAMMKAQGMSMSDVREQLESGMQDGYYSVDSRKRDYKITDVTDVTGAELSQLQAMYQMLQTEVTAAKRVSVSVTYTTPDGKESEEIDIPLVKLGRSWYLDMTGM